MKKRIPWFDMFGFYVLLPFLTALVGWISHVIYSEQKNAGFLGAGLFFYAFTWFLLCSSVGIFVIKLVREMWKAIGNALCETWDEMVSTAIEAQSG